MDRINYEIQDITAGIMGSPSGVGDDISLTHAYDDIKEARFSEDDSVSFGIWERELKKADWSLVEKLSVDAIRNKSKDFQILGWLVEALEVLDGFSGLVKGMKIMDAFLKAFWETGYPHNEDDSSDSEQKIRILEWIFDVVEKKSKFIPFARYSGDDAVNLYDYEYAIDLKNSMIRMPNSSDSILESAKKSGRKTIEDVLNMINVTTQTDIAETIGNIQAIRSEKANLDVTLKQLTGNDMNAFSGLIANLEKIERLLTQQKQSEQPETEQPPENKGISTNPEPQLRDEIYDQIAELASKLKVIEKHSPSSFILNLVFSWKNKNLLEITDDLKSGDSEAHKLLKFLIS